MSITQNVVGRKLRYNNFNLSHTHDTSGRIGKLIPVQATPVVAGDLFSEKLEFNIRMAPLSAPAMARFNVHFHSFYVPYRILTPRNGPESTWEQFVMSVGKPLSEVPELPHVYTSSLWSIYDYNRVGAVDDTTLAYLDWFEVGSLWDYLKLPVLSNFAAGDANLDLTRESLGVPGIILFNFLAYQWIWNCWYRRDQIEPEMLFPNSLAGLDLCAIHESRYVQPEKLVNSDRQFDIIQFAQELFTLRTRNYERDYFTTNLPEPQFGDDVVIGGDISVAPSARISIGALTDLAIYTQGDPANGSGLLRGGIQPIYQTPSGYPSIVEYEDNEDTYFRFGLSQYGHNDSLDMNVRDIQGVGGVNITVNELRLAMQLQGVRESINRGGTRYIEIMKSVFGVSVNDLRLQRPQYLGGIKAPISIGAVLQTSASTENSPQGNMTGQGGSVGGNVLFRTKRIFEEAGVVMTIMSVTPRTGYFGGIERQYLKHDPTEYYVPAFDHLGEQETYRAELKYHLDSSEELEATNDTLRDDRYLGYAPHYEDYKATYSTVTGEFRTTLNNWNVFRTFDKAPVLSPEFIHAEPEDFDRIFMFENVENTSNEHFYANLYFDISAKRPMSKYSTPITLF